MGFGHDLQQQFHDCMPLFIALGDEVRLTIIELLSQALQCGPEQGLNVNEITCRTNLSRPAISHHLKILKDSGLVEIRKFGTSNYYHLTLEDGTRKLMDLGFLVQKSLYRN